MCGYNRISQAGLFINNKMYLTHGSGVSEVQVTHETLLAVSAHCGRQKVKKAQETIEQERTNLLFE